MRVFYEESGEHQPAKDSDIYSKLWLTELQISNKGGNDRLRHFNEEVLPMLETIEIKTQIAIENEGTLEAVMLATTSGGSRDVIKYDNKPVYLSLVL